MLLLFALFITWHFWGILQSKFPRKQTQVLYATAPHWQNSIKWDNIIFYLPTHSHLFPRHPLKPNQQVHLQYFSRKGDKESNQYFWPELACVLNYVSPLTTTKGQVIMSMTCCLPASLLKNRSRFPHLGIHQYQLKGTSTLHIGKI